MVAAGNYIMLTIVVVNQIKVKALKLYIIDIPIKHIKQFERTCYSDYAYEVIDNNTSHNIS